MAAAPAALVEKHGERAERTRASGTRALARRDGSSGIAQVIRARATQVARVHVAIIGRATVEALRLNNDWLVSARRIWVRAGLHPPLE